MLFNRKHVGRALEASENWDDDFEFQQEGDSDEQRSCKGQLDGNSSKNEGRKIFITSTLEDWNKEKNSNTNLPRPVSSTSDLIRR